MAGILKNNALLNSKILLANFYLALGGGILLSLGGFWIYHQIREKTNPPVHIVLASQEVIDPPILLTIPEKVENLRLKEGRYQYNNWAVDPNQAIYLQGSLDNSYSQNLIIYGHNKKGVFAKLKDVRKKDKVFLTTQNGQIVVYQITSIKIVPSTDLSILNQQLKNRITIFTCTGLFDSQRLVVVGEKIS